MINRAAATSPGQAWAYRLAIPVAALCVFGGLVLFWAAGEQSVLLTVIRISGFDPGAFPFFDMQAVLAAAECSRQGFNVYLSNPCDMTVYSPLWLALVPDTMGSAATPWVGGALDLLFILSLPLLIRPRGPGELVVFVVAVFSPTVFYALDRANIDLVMFLLALAAGLLQARSRGWRLCSYPVLILAALLKYYPAVLLALVARERRRDAAVVAAGATAVMALFAFYYRDVLPQALANIPRVSYYTDSFSAKNLPYGLVAGLPHLPAPGIIAIALFVILAISAQSRFRGTAALLEAGGFDLTTNEVRLAAIGGLVMAGCFFTAQNVDYRAIFLLFALPGLMQLRCAAVQPSARRQLAFMIAVLLFLMWSDFCRHGLLVLDFPPGGRVYMAYWVAHEILWWWLIAWLGAVAICHVRRLPLTRDLSATAKAIFVRWATPGRWPERRPAIGAPAGDDQPR